MLLENTDVTACFCDQVTLVKLEYPLTVTLHVELRELCVSVPDV